MAVAVTFNKRVPPGAGTRGTLAEIMAKQKAAMDAAGQATQMETPTIMQGLGKLGMIGANVFKEKRAEKAGAAGRADLAKMISGFNPDAPDVQQTIANMSVIDPAAAQFYQEAILERQKQAAKDAAEGGPKISDSSSMVGHVLQDPSYKNLQQAVPIWSSMQDAATRRTPQAHLNMVIALAKLFDPTSVVRTQEGEQVVNTGGLPAQVWSGWQFLKGNPDGTLPEDVVRGMLQEGSSRMAGYYSAYGQTQKTWQDYAVRHGMDPADIPSFQPFTPYVAPETPPRPPVPPETPPETPAPETDTGPAFIPKPAGYVGHWPETEDQWLRMPPAARQQLLDAAADPRNRTPPRVVGP